MIYNTNNFEFKMSGSFVKRLLAYSVFDYRTKFKHHKMTFYPVF